MRTGWLIAAVIFALFLTAPIGLFVAGYALSGDFISETATAAVVVFLVVAAMNFYLFKKAAEPAPLKVESRMVVVPRGALTASDLARLREESAPGRLRSPPAATSAGQAAPISEGIVVAGDRPVRIEKHEEMVIMPHEDIYEQAGKNGFDAELMRIKQIIKYILKPEELREKLGELSNAIFLGIGHTIDGSAVALPFKSFGNNHSGIFGKSGSGKSYGASVALEELIRRGIPVVVFDVSGEWFALKKLEDLARKSGKNLKVQSITIKSLAEEFGTDRAFQVPLSEMTTDDFITLTTVMSSSGKDAIGQKQEYLLTKLFDYIKHHEDIKTFTDLVRWAEEKSAEEVLAEIGVSDIKEYKKSWTGVFTRIYNLARNPITRDFAGDERVRVEEIDKPYTVTIVRLPSAGAGQRVETTVALLMVHKLLKELYRYRMSIYQQNPDYLCLPIVLFIDEAHNYFNTAELKSLIGRFGDTFVATAVKMIKEVRKFNIAMLIASQSPDDIDNRILEQLNTVFIGLLSENKARQLKNYYRFNERLVDYIVNMRSEQFHEFFMLSSYISRDKPILMRFRRSFVKT
ncbi:ATP-binding protein [Thermococcus sp. MAR1]|uniref:ATP-binding protein n=1 Tax=Thermococcus sp. MAR1 TaxID=1638263 RepID=UPI001439862C|nr:ATP-binding protein [Thermococcus sp. MAR1]NJE09333.1 ATP-binding protein [Thermococcus sp. MAR1]